MMKTELQEYYYCNVVGQTDVGCKRAANEDNWGKSDTPNGRVAVVCDGMGGHVGGATASKIAVETILNYLEARYHDDPGEAITEAIDAANRAILDHAAAHPELTGMGSTCVLLLVRDGRVHIGHVGDSRIYLIRDRKIQQLTKDHSYVQTLVDAGMITPAQAEHHPRKNEITNALGIPSMQSATLRLNISPEGGDVFLLCSDGLSGMVADAEICDVARRLTVPMQSRADALIERAKQHGGLDNITCALVEFSCTPNAVSERPVWWKRPAVIGGIGAAVVLIVAILFVWKYYNGEETDDSGGKDTPDNSTAVVSDVGQPAEGEKSEIQNAPVAPKRKTSVTLSSLTVQKVNKNKEVVSITFHFGNLVIKELLNRRELYRGEVSLDKNVHLLNNILYSEQKDNQSILLRINSKKNVVTGDTAKFSLGNDSVEITFLIPFEVERPRQSFQVVIGQSSGGGNNGKEAESTTSTDEPAKNVEAGESDSSKAEGNAAGASAAEGSTDGAEPASKDSTKASGDTLPDGSTDTQPQESTETSPTTSV